MLNPDSSSEPIPPPVTSSHVLEIAHVLFMDIVAYSQKPMDEQTRLIELLQEIVRNTAEFGRAHAHDQLLRLPTGDGMALVFFGDAEAPAKCALEISRALHSQPDLKLRMGIHTGPVHRVADINANKNVAGGGINLAQRVMDCGDASHILVSKSVADVLGQMSNWHPMLHDLGEAEVKHGVVAHIYNLYTADAGSPKLPQKFLAASATRAKAKRKNFSLMLIAIGVLASLAVGSFYYFRQPRKLTDRDTIVLADFDNKTGDAVFDDTLKTALSVSLNQSPFLNVLSESKVTTILKLMMRPPDTMLTPDVAREVCQRSGSNAYLAGSIASLGSQYVLALKVLNCQSGDMLAQEQATAAAKEKVLDALGEAASKLRGELGESLLSVEEFDVPLAEATTSSLEALKAYSLGEKSFQEKGGLAALPYHQRAIELDPNFAKAYESMGADYFAVGELGRASEYLSKAFQLREHASERENLAIATDYYENVTGELDKAAQANLELIARYPRASHNRLGLIYAQQGDYEKAAEEYRESLRIIPDEGSALDNLPYPLLALQRFDEAREAIVVAQARKQDDFILHDALYALTFLGADSLAMAKQQEWFAGKLVESFGFSLASDTEAYSGHLGNARELTKRSVNSAIRSDSKESGAIWLENTALREAAFGNFTRAKQTAEEGLKLVPTSQGIAVEAALAYAMADETVRAESLMQDLNKRYPLDTQTRSLWLPVIRAQLALNRKNPGAATNSLEPVMPPIEYGQIMFIANISCLYPTYIRGEAYLAAGHGQEAAAEFQKILDHSGIVWNCWTGALAHLQLGRAYMMGGDTAKARAAYQEFLTLWKDADPDIPILKQAKAEYAKLQ